MFEGASSMEDATSEVTGSNAEDKDVPMAGEEELVTLTQVALTMFVGS